MDERGKGFLNLRSGKKVLKRGVEVGKDDGFNNGESRGDSGNGSAKRSRNTRTQKQEEGEETNSVVGVVKIETQNVAEGSNSADSNKRGKRKVVTSSSGNDVVAVDDRSASAGRRRLSREEKGKAVMVDGDLPRNAVENSDAKNSEDSALRDREQSRNTNNNNPKEHGSSRMERFRDIARENASRFAHFAADDDDDDENGDDRSLPEAEVEHEIEDWPGPFSTAMKIIRDREKKSIQTGCGSSERSLVESVKWVPKTSQGGTGAKFSVPSLQELCLKILARNVDAIVSLDSVPDALRHRLSQLLCDSRKMNGHFFELLVCGSPTEIRLRDCSWLTEEQFTKCFQMCDTANLVVRTSFQVCFI